MDENRYFQYLAGVRGGEVLLFDRIEEEDGIVFVCFKDGSRCNEDLILPLNERNPGTMLMAEVENHKNVWTFNEKWVGREEERWETNQAGESVCVQPLIEGRKIVTPIPPRKSKAKFGIMPDVNAATQAPKNPQRPQLVGDPVWVMMDKAKKFDTDVPMALTISLPSKSLYNVAKESFEDGGNKVVEYIISNLDDAQLKASLKEALKEAYEDTDAEVVEEPIITDQKPAMDLSATLFEPEVVEEAIVGEPQAEGKMVPLSKNDEKSDG